MNKSFLFLSNDLITCVRRYINELVRVLKSFEKITLDVFYILRKWSVNTGMITSIGCSLCVWRLKIKNLKKWTLNYVLWNKGKIMWFILSLSILSIKFLLILPCKKFNLGLVFFFGNYFVIILESISLVIDRVITNTKGSFI